MENISKSGVLSSQLQATSSEKLKDSPGALSAKINVQPFENKTVTFVLAWDFPVLESGYGTKWYKRYTKFVGKDGRNVAKIARKAFNEHERWLLEIKKWQEGFL